MPRVSKKRKAAFSRWISRKKARHIDNVHSGSPATDAGLIHEEHDTVRSSELLMVDNLQDVPMPDFGNSLMLQPALDEMELLEMDGVQLEPPLDGAEYYYAEPDIEQLLTTLHSTSHSITDGYPTDLIPGTPLLAKDEEDQFGVTDESVSWKPQTEDNQITSSNNISMGHARRENASIELEELILEECDIPRSMDIRMNLGEIALPEMVEIHLPSPLDGTESFWTCQSDATFGGPPETVNSLGLTEMIDESSIDIESGPPSLVRYGSTQSVVAEDASTSLLHLDEEFDSANVTVAHSVMCSGDRFEEIVTDKEPKKTVTLTRSRTRIISIPGAPSGKFVDSSPDCSCEACVKTAENNQRNQHTPTCAPKNFVPQTDKSTEEEMQQMYTYFDGLSLPTRKANQSFVPTNKSGKSLQRLQVTNADDYVQFNIPKWKELNGRRIIDLNYFLKWTIMSQAIHSRNCCGILCPYQEDIRSMTSTLWLVCNVCNIVVKGSSEQPSSGARLRFCTNWAILCSGSTYTMAHEIFSFMDIPFMHRKSFFKDEMAMDAVLEKALNDSLNKAVEEEVKLSSAQQGCDKSANICCELDGSWGQRSNGHRYSSASGCAAIIGTKTKKVVFIGTRNKRCSACNRNAARLKANKSTRPHKCYKNYSGASGGMESDVVIEGFQKLYEKGVKITTVITDGDSTTVSKLKNSSIYGHEIKHQLCCNHTIKNARKKLREIKCPKQYADQVTNKINRITKGVRSAIKHCAENGSSDIEGLRSDIRNVPYHVFDNHSSCRDYFCKYKDATISNPTIIADLENNGIWEKILIVMEKLASKAEFLCENKTSNLAENLFCRLCKYNVGKRVDTMSRGSFQRRVTISALMCNENYTWHEKYMKMFTGQAPGFWTKKMFEEKSKALKRTRKAQKNPNFRRRSGVAQQEKEIDYGEEAVEAAENAARDTLVVDIPTMRMQYKIDEITTKRLCNSITITEMEELAKGRIISKFVPEIINARETTKWKKCDLLLQTTNTWNFLKSNRAVVGLVLRVLKEEHAFDLGESRMFIDSCHGYLCSFPDAISMDGSMILLIRKKDSSANIKDQVSTQRGVLGCKMKDGVLILDRNAMVEIQTALHVCSSSKCLIYFMFGTNATDYLFKIVDRDENFFIDKVEPKLNHFFENFFLKKVFEKQILIKQ